MILSSTLLSAPISGSDRSSCTAATRRVAALALLVFSASMAMAQPALVTILEGEATVIDGVRRFAAVEGQTLAERSLVETGPQTRLLRIEWPDGSVVDLGPDTRAMLAPAGAAKGGRRGPAFHLLQGWAKQGSLGKAAAAGQQSAALEVAPFTGSAVSQVQAERSWFFVESGEATLTEREIRPPSRLTLKAGEVYTREGRGKGATAPRPTPDQLRAVPRAFRDTLPLRAAQFAGKTPTRQPLPAPDYAALKPWLTAETAVRADFPRRFAALARDPAFRRGLIDNLAAHPEWRPVLYPDPPKPASAPAPASATWTPS
jgi:hypothetical protein